MSMWLNMVKVSPQLLEVVQARPDLLDRVFLEEVAPGVPPLPPGFEKEADTTTYQLSSVTEAIEGHARARGEEDTFWALQDTWLTKAIGIGGEKIGYDFAQGPGWLRPPDRVAEIADGLAVEALAARPPAGEARSTEDERAWAYAKIVRSFENFYAAASREGKAVIGGVS